MKTSTTNASDLETFINQTPDLVSQQELFLTDSVIIDIEELISDVSNLISLPRIYLKIKELMVDPESCLNDFAIVVNTDPGLIASVLKIVNSAFFGFPGQIDNINRALNLIGIGQLHDLVLSLSAVDALDLPNDIETLEIFWQRSIYCGVFSRLLAEKLDLQETESLFVIGLLHEIGHLILFLKYPKESKLTVNQAEAENRSLLEIEKNNFNTDYAKIGQALMAEWNLPLKFQHITEHHTDPNLATELVLETTILHIAHQVAVNQFPGADKFQYSLSNESLALLSIKEEEMNALYQEANTISHDMEKLILGE